MNGARGTVEAVIKTGSDVHLVLVVFEHPRVGVTAITQSQYQDQHPSTVPISRHEAVFKYRKKQSGSEQKTVATTIHRDCRD